MKILAVGDPHGNLDKIKRIPVNNIDLVLITGDLGRAELARKNAFDNIKRRKEGKEKKELSKIQEEKIFFEIYNSTIKILKYFSRFAPTYMIFGNVEPSSNYCKKLGKLLEKPIPTIFNEANKIKNVKVINNRIVKFKEIRIGGLEFFLDTNWVSEFKPSDYKEAMRKAKKQTNKANKILKWFGKVDILLHHQPPHSYLDKVTFRAAPKQWLGKHAGSKAILRYIKRKQPKFCFCGHIHEGKGNVKIGKSEVFNLGVAGYKIINIK